MTQQTVDPKASNPGNTQNALPDDSKQLPVAVKKTSLQDLPNENNVITSKSTPKEGDIEGFKIAGTKRSSPDSPTNPSHHQSPGGNHMNGHLVYVRRKPETEGGKNSTDETMLENSANSLTPGQVVVQPQQVITHEKPQLKESRVPCLPAFAPIPAASSLSFSSGKLSVPPESHSHPVASAAPPSDQKRMNIQSWEERYIQLQMFLKKLDQSSIQEYLEKLQALPAAELSRHAVELERRSIQLSLEEGIELKRVKALDVLGKSKNFKPLQ